MEREISHGWTEPLLKDRVVLDVRHGLSLRAICERQVATRERVLELAARALRNGLITQAEFDAVTRGRNSADA